MIRITILIAALCGTAAGCSRLQPIHDIADTRVSVTESEDSSRLIREAIVAGATRKGWRLDEVENGHFVAQVLVRQHIAEVDIYFDDDSYRIEYRDSENLLYDGARIHRNYNKWVILLNREIQASLPSNILIGT